MQGPEGQTFVVDQGMALQHFFLWTFHNNYEAVSGWLTTDIDVGIVGTCNIQHDLICFILTLICVPSDDNFNTKHYLDLRKRCKIRNWHDGAIWWEISKTDVSFQHIQTSVF